MNITVLSQLPSPDRQSFPCLFDKLRQEQPAYACSKIMITYWLHFEQYNLVKLKLNSADSEQYV